MSNRLTEEQQNEAERLVWRVMDGEHEDYIDAHAAFAAICDQADAARRFLALTETGQRVVVRQNRLGESIIHMEGNPLADAADNLKAGTYYVIPADYLTEEE